MFATAVILFREVLEMAVVVGVVMAAAEGAPGRNRWIGVGVLAGLFGASLVAVFADAISDAAAGMGQEYFNTAILLAATLLIGWTVVWMKTHGRDIAVKLKATGRAVVAGDSPMHMLAVVVGLAVLREGSEAVLFVYGVALSQSHTALELVAGSALGLAAGAAVGAALYLGLLKVSAKHLFGVTGALLALLASGMAAQAAGYLVAAGALPAILDPLWDSSWLLDQSSTVGRLLSVLVGYQDHPSATQVIAYLLTLSVILSFGRAGSRPMPPPLP